MEIAHSVERSSHKENEMVIARAPLRISFGGGGTDLAAYYQAHGGYVVSATITRYCYVIARPTPDGSIRINSADYRTWQTFPRGRTPAVREPLLLPKAVLQWFRQHDLLQDGVDLFMASEVAGGTGLGSSSAMTVALIRALAAYCGLPLNSSIVADLACQVEIDRLKMPIGKQDQYASAVGGLNTIEFTSGGVVVRPLALPLHVADALCARLLLFSTGRTHDSAEILRQQQTDSASKETVIQALHRLKSLAREMRDALVLGDLDQFGHLMNDSWQEKKRLSTKISTAAIDRWYEAAREAGALGGKISGAGGGGFMMLYCPLRRQRALRERLADLGLREMSFDFDTTGAQQLSPADMVDHQMAVANPFDGVYDSPYDGCRHSNGDSDDTVLQQQVENYWQQLTTMTQAMPHRAIINAARLLVDCHRRRGAVFVLGNGGSAATASHFAFDLAQAARAAGQPPFRVVSLTDNVVGMTAWANDTSYDRVFAEQLDGLVGPGDVVVAISTNGDSGSVLSAAEAARQADATILAVTGYGNNRLHQLADVSIRVPPGLVEQMEDTHLAIFHSLCVALRERLRRETARAVSETELLTHDATQVGAVGLE